MLKNIFCPIWKLAGQPAPSWSASPPPSQAPKGLGTQAASTGAATRALKVAGRRPPAPDPELLRALGARREAAEAGRAAAAAAPAALRLRCRASRGPGWAAGCPQGDRSRPPSSADAPPGLQDAVLQQDTRPARTAPPRNPAAEGLLPRGEGRTCRPGAASLRKRSRRPPVPRTENLERLRHRHALLHRTAGRPGSSPRWNPEPPLPPGQAGARCCRKPGGPSGCLRLPVAALRGLRGVWDGPCPEPARSW